MLWVDLGGFSSDFISGVVVVSMCSTLGGLRWYQLEDWRNMFNNGHCYTCSFHYN